MQPHILLVGNDDRHLSTRRLILRCHGIHATEIPGLRSLTEGACLGVAVAVLCHSLSSDELRRAVHAIRRASPTAMILQLRSPQSQDLMIEHASASVLQGPAEMVAAVLDLLRLWDNHLP